jgi:ABC-type oligopeptide transport system ATPase subunit
MHRGRLVECGRTADVLQSPTDPYTQTLVHAATDVGRLAPQPGNDRS